MRRSGVGGGNAGRSGSDAYRAMWSASKSRSWLLQRPIGSDPRATFELQDLAGQIQAAADQHPGRAASPRGNGAQARRRRAGRAGRCRRRPRRSPRPAARRCCSGSATAQTRRGQRQQRAQELRRVLRLLHADDQMDRPVAPSLADAPPEPRRRRDCGRRPARVPSPAAACAASRPCRRCSRAGHSAVAMPGAMRVPATPGRRRAARRSRCRHCRAGAGPAATAAAASSAPVASRVAKPGAGRLDRPSRGRAAAPARRCARRRSQQDRARTSGGCAPVATGTPGFMIPAFSAGDQLQRRRPATPDDPARSR